MEKYSKNGFCAVDILEETDSGDNSNKLTIINSREDSDQQKPTITADISGDTIKDPADSQPIVVRWYFVPDPKNDGDMDAVKDSEDVLKFRCTTKNNPSVQVEASKRLTEWRTDVSKLKSGLYDIVLGVSTQSLDTEKIESIAFSAEIHGESEGSNETIARQELTRMCTLGCGIHKWKLHGQLLIVADDDRTDDDGEDDEDDEDDDSEEYDNEDDDEDDDDEDDDEEDDDDEDDAEEDDSAADDDEYDDPSGKLTIRMKITTSTGISTAVGAGFLTLHFMELRAFRLDGYNDESSIVAHRPYTWSLNIRRIGSFLDGSTQLIPEKIIAFAISGNGRYVATIASTGSLNHFLLAVWDLQDPTGTSTYIGAAKASHKQEELPSNTPPSQPHACAVAVIPRPEPVSYAIVDSFRISLSWDGSKVSVAAWIEYVQGSPRSIFSVYHRDQDVPHSQKALPISASSAMTILRPSTDHQHCTELEKFYGYGVFHIADSANPDVQRELFIAWDHERIHIYRVYCQWNHLHTITAVPQYALWHIGVQGQYLAVAETEYSVVWIWNAELGSIASVVVQEGSNGRVTRVSSNGDIMAVSRNTDITLHWTATGAILGSFTLPGRDPFVTNLRFIQDDTQLLVTFDCRDGDSKQRTTGLILETSDMTVVDRFSVPEACIAQSESESGSGTTFHSLHGATLDLVPSYSQLRNACTNQCRKDLAPLLDSRHIVTLEHPTVFTAPSGLHYRIELQEGPGLSVSSVVSISSNDRTSSKTFIIPHQFTGYEDEDTILLDTSLRLVGVSDYHIRVWQLPATLDDDLKVGLLKQLRKSYHWVTCPHQEIYMVDNEDVGEIWPCYVESWFGSRDGNNLHSEMYFVIDTFLKADPACKKAILEYISPHINNYYDPDNLSDPMLATLCRWWGCWDEDMHDQFVPELLAFPATRWLLRPDTTLDSNPLRILFDLTTTELEFMRLVNILIDYCFHRARADRELGFLFPVLQCLHAMVDPKGLHTDLGIQVLLRSAYLPIKSRSFLVGHFSIAHPPEFRWQFWKPNMRPLYECKDPILQLVNEDKRDILNRKFTRALCAAPFALLWRYKGDTVHRPDRPCSPSKTPPSWIHMFFALVQYKCKPAVEENVRCHDFALDMLDHPAIAALIEYKWNTIGFKYCMVRFLFLCCYYLLVLAVVFLQVYGGYHGTLFGVFIAVAVSSSIFLWFELIQLFREWRRYVSSMYNVVDIMAFGLPLAASVNHFLILSGTIDGRTPEEGHAGFLSFSVLFIFLHVLFELRISKSVCKFVTIIIGAFIKIRLFFFILAGGVISFSIAILHLLRSCPFKECLEPDPPISFPEHFYGAFSATFFYMASIKAIDKRRSHGGRYDSINNEFDSNNWAFQTLMIFYFFFTVILMLNVLIALINMAFTDGGETWYLVWLENRMRVIESVENLTFHIPGFREHYNWFPDEIYYSATAKKIADFEARYPADNCSKAAQSGSSSLPTATADVPKTTDADVAKTEKLTQELKDELQRTREQVFVLQEQKASVEKHSTVMQEHIQEQKEQIQVQRASAEKEAAALQQHISSLQEQVKTMQVMLSTFLTDKTTPSPS
ncbi:hypothetical protein BG011_008687 [Mortierella polycephala]|uniref:Ion transport domain-containing protein n=1 Tax=Mortierella polycephala TaxID=41804 RepID=A0A9P6Q9D5_9FUNG|nr:hypothetical protein BG011_008687 [Mortierella polycephala]